MNRDSAAKDGEGRVRDASRFPDRRIYPPWPKRAAFLATGLAAVAARILTWPRRALGTKRVIITPGNYGADFANAVCAIPESDLVKCSNFVGKVVDMAANEGFEEVLLIGHIGKLIKVSGGVMNTHSREADCRAELMAVAAIRAGADAALARQILECVTTDEMLRVINEAGLLEKTMAAVEEKIDFYLKNRVRDKCVIGAIVFSEDYGTLCTTGPARAWLEEMRKREKTE